MDTLNLLITEHAGQTEEQLESLTQQAGQTKKQLKSLTQDLETICSKLESLRGTTTQLSTDLQEVQTGISNIACSDSEETSQLIQNLQDDITKQLTDIESKVDTLFDQRYTCGGTGGWRHAVSLDLSDETTSCPNGWELTTSTPRTCGASVTSNPFCYSATFPVSGGEYNRVCGRIKAYQFNSPGAFTNFFSGTFTEIDDAYAYGVSLTYGSPRNHIWTFAAGSQEIITRSLSVCPCSTSPEILSATNLPPFVGEDFFCESGNNFGMAPPGRLLSDDVLWDGEDCGSVPACCTINNPPFFTKQLPCPTSEAIEARICGDTAMGTVAIERVELYVQ